MNGSCCSLLMNFSLYKYSNFKLHTASEEIYLIKFCDIPVRITRPLEVTRINGFLKKVTIYPDLYLIQEFFYIYNYLNTTPLMHKKEQTYYKSLTKNR